jgi:hypothetical protein
MKSKNIIYKLIVMVLFLTSCTDLNEVIYSEITETSFVFTENDTYKAIGAVYTPIRGIGGVLQYAAAQEVTSDEVVMPYNPVGGWNDGGVYRTMHLHTWTTEDSYINNMWNQFYSGILNCNRIISQLESGILPVPEKKKKKALIAEMKSARAFYYWLLIDNYGDIPMVAPGETILPSITPRAAVYDSIVNDLNQSIPNLIDLNNKTMYGRFNKWGAKTLLANIYLNAKEYSGKTKWNECLQQCNEVIASGAYSLEPRFTDIFKTKNESSPEIIFSIPYDNINGTGWSLHLAMLHSALKAKYLMEATPSGSGAIKAIPQFINMYDKLDQRLNDTYLIGLQFAYDGVTPCVGFQDQKGKQLNFINSLPNGIQVGEAEGYRIGKFEIEIGAKANLSNDFPFFRYAQVLMMKAECLLRDGKADEAAAIVTQVRQRSFKNNPTKAIKTGLELKSNSKYQYGYVDKYVITEPGNSDVVEFGGFLDELGFEFTFELQRRRDLIRFDVFTKKSWLSHKPNGVFRKVFPIPKKAIDTNVNLKQNPAYK